MCPYNTQLRKAVYILLQMSFDYCDLRRSV